MRLHPLFLAPCLALSFPVAATFDQDGDPPDNDVAGDPAAPGDAREFDRITVTATRTDRAIADVPNTVDVIDRERMDATLVRDLQDLFRYEPGVTATSSYGRFGIGDIRIRGLGGNRVRIQTDNIAVPDAFAIGSFSNANRNVVDLDTLKRVEVVRGPTSSLYGSDALGGIVSFVTRDPADYLRDGKTGYVGLRLGYDGSRDGLFGSATGAFGGDRWSGLIAVGHRQGQEQENQGRNDSEGAARTTPNPQQGNGRSVLAKVLYAPDARQQFRLTVDANEDSTDTDLLSSRGFQSMTRATNLDVTGHDHQSRARVSFDHAITLDENAFADAIDWQVYRQQSETTQDTVEVRATAATQTTPSVRQRRARRFDFDQRIDGVQANAHTAFATGDAAHTLSCGIDVSRTDTRQKRDGRVTNLATGASSNVISPETFPVRDFPISRTTSAALYVQDEIAFAGDAFRLVPAVRVDRYELEPENDPIFAADNPGVAVRGLTKTSVSPKLGAVWHLTQDWSLFGGYARGFRSPPYADVNIGFTNAPFGYTAIANPDLKPETSDGLEFGARVGGDAAYASVSTYFNQYRDFIASLRPIGQNADGLTVYQSQNIAKAWIYGVEWKGGVELGALAPGLEGWSLRAAAAWSRGKGRGPETIATPPPQEPVTRDVSRDLDSVDPLTASLGVAYDRETWGTELAGRFVGAKRGASHPDVIRPGGYGVLDLLAHWRFAPGARVDAGLFNLADRRYVESGDLAIGASSRATLDRYTSPGRHLSFSLAMEW